MSDVEGVRNLIGTGLVEFVGGMLTAVMAFVFLLHRSAQMTLIVFSVIGVFVFILQYAFKTIRPIFRERGKITGEVTGRLTESLGGVRVIKGYHAEEREAAVLRGRAAPAGQRDEDADHDQRDVQAATTVLGIVGAGDADWADIWLCKARWTTGTYIQYTMFLAFMIAPVIPGGEYRHATDRGGGGHRSHHGDPLRERRIRGSGARRQAGRDLGARAV